MPLYALTILNQVIQIYIILKATVAVSLKLTLQKSVKSAITLSSWIMLAHAPTPNAHTNNRLH